MTVKGSERLLAAGAKRVLEILMTDDLKLIYLVHDDSDVLLSLYDVLSAAGFQVAASSNALDALAYIARTKPRCVLYRWELPQMEGPEFIERARRFSPGTRLIVGSRNADGEMYGQIRRLGATDLLREPFNPTTVIQAVSRMTGLGVPYEAGEDPASIDADPGAEGRSGTCRG